MKKFNVKFQREFDAQIEADTPAMAAQMLSRQVGSCKVLSIIADDYIERPCPACKDAVKSGGKPPHGTPEGGGNPGATVVRVPVLVDQIAAAA